MAKLLKLRRGTTTQHSTFTGAEGECTVDLDKDVIVVHDGSTQAGHPLAAEDLSNVSSATIVGRLNAASIPTVNIASGALPTNVTITTNNITDLTVATADLADAAVTAAKLASNAVVNASVDASAAIAGTKISPDFGSQNVVTTGNVNAADIQVAGTLFHEGDTDTKLEFGTNQMILKTGNVNRFEANNSSLMVRTGFPLGFASSSGNSPNIKSGNTNNQELLFTIDNTERLAVEATGIDVTGNITVSGTVDGVDVAALNTSVSGLGISSGAIASATTATTQSASDNSTKVATTAYVETAVSNLVDSSPSALNTLNELAAAINDDANFSTTMTNNLATKFALAGGGTITGDFTIASGTTNKNINVDVSDHIRFDDNLKATFGNSDDLQIFHDASNSYIRDMGTGNLNITGSQIVLANAAFNENMITAVEDGAVTLFHDGSSKLATTSGGISVTGAVYSSTGVVGEDASNHFDFVTDNRIAVSINGSEEFRFTSGGDFHADGDVIAFSTTISSDKNLKENIEVIPNALDKVEALRGVTFDWKRDLTPSAGVIAQEVEAVLPEAVKEVTNLKDGGSHLAVNYHALTSILIESIKELSARVKELEAK